MSLLKALLGTPLPSKAEDEERIGVLRGVAVFGLDALGSAAYGPEAALTVLLPLGVMGLRYSLPITGLVVALLLVVYFSYRQTITAYPSNGGAYTVAGENLGRRVGLVAGAALMIDYLLNVCVGISTGIGALVSAVPRLQPHTLALCLAVLVLITLVNLRGVHDTGTLWLLPTYVFVACLTVVILWGVWQARVQGWHPVPHTPLPHPAKSTADRASFWLLLRAFASGCAALTGVEAVSNGVGLFRDPKDKIAKRTLTLIVALLAFLLVGLTVVARRYGVTATEPGSSGYQSVISLVTGAVAGRGVMYAITMASVLVVLSLSANTSFTGFPQLCYTMAKDGYLPEAFENRGRRLAYTVGVVSLAGLAAVLLTIFGGVTDRLIPLFAIGAFLAFTFSQAGMVMHWRKSKERGAGLHAAINGFGAVCTAVTAVVVFLAKFMEGAWITAALLVGIVLLLLRIRRHYDAAAKALCVEEETMTAAAEPEPTMLVPVAKWNRASQEALKLAGSLSQDVRLLHITDQPEKVSEQERMWQALLEKSLQGSERPAPRVIALCSPYRSLADPILEYVKRVEQEKPGHKIAVVVAEVVAAQWFEHLLHNYRAMGLKRRLFAGGHRNVVIIDVPWQLPPTS